MGSGELTQKEAAVILGVSSERVRQFVLAKALTPVRFVKGSRPIFYAVDVEALRVQRGTNPHAKLVPRAEPAVALLAFDMFTEGRSMRDVMVALDLIPQKVRALHKEWQTPLGGSPPKATPARATFAELSAESAREAEEFGAAFDREQAARKTKAERERADRMQELEDIGRGKRP